MKELGSGTAYNTHNTTLLIRTLKYVSCILQTEEAFTVEEYKHAYTHTHTHTHTHYLQLPSFSYFPTSNTKNKKDSNNKMALICVGEVTSRIKGHHVYNHKYKIGKSFNM